MGIDGFGMLRRRAADRAIEGAERDRQTRLAARHIAQLGCLVDDLIEAAIDEGRDLDLANRPHPRHRGAHRGADEAGLGNRRIAHPLGAKLLMESAGTAESAEHHVLAEQEGQGIALHLFGESRSDCLQESYLRHANLENRK
jgi:hypothetical protein